MIVPALLCAVGLPAGFFLIRRVPACPSGQPHAADESLHRHSRTQRGRQFATSAAIDRGIFGPPARGSGR